MRQFAGLWKVIYSFNRKLQTKRETRKLFTSSHFKTSYMPAMLEKVRTAVNIRYINFITLPKQLVGKKMKTIIGQQKYPTSDSLASLLLSYLNIVHKTRKISIPANDIPEITTFLTFNMCGYKKHHVHQ